MIMRVTTIRPPNLGAFKVPASRPGGRLKTDISFA